MPLVRTIPAALAALALLVPPGAAQAATPRQKQRIAEIAQNLRTEGANKTLERYFYLGSDPGPAPGYALVKTGDPRAVKIGVAMLSVSDAGFTERLLSSLATALAKNPRAVLPYVGSSTLLSSQNICIPFFAYDDPNAGAEAKAGLDRAEKALKTVHEKAFTTGKNFCLGAIAQYREDMRRARSAER